LVVVLPQTAEVVRAAEIRGVSRESLSITHQGQETQIEIYPHRPPDQTGHVRDAALVFVPEGALR
jgi:hypothetical protein